MKASSEFPQPMSRAAYMLTAQSGRRAPARERRTARAAVTDAAAWG